MANFTQHDIDEWFKACGWDQKPNIVKAYIDAGFDVDVRNDHGQTALYFLADLMSSSYPFLSGGTEIISMLISGLQKQYAVNPEKLVNALEASPAGHNSPLSMLRYRSVERDSCGHAANELDKAIDDAKLAHIAHISGQPTLSPVEKPSPRSEAPPPLKADKTLTLVRLQEKKPDGRTNLQIFDDQGQLGDVFTTEIWQGRRAEMDKAWELVPTQHQNQVNIELVRAHIGVAEGRARFSTGSDDREQGL